MDEPSVLFGAVFVENGDQLGTSTACVDVLGDGGARDGGAAGENGREPVLFVEQDEGLVGREAVDVCFCAVQSLVRVERFGRCAVGACKQAPFHDAHGLRFLAAVDPLCGFGAKLVMQEVVGLSAESVFGIGPPPMGQACAALARHLEVKLDGKLDVQRLFGLVAKDQHVDLTRCAPVFPHRQVVAEQCEGGVVFYKPSPQALEADAKGQLARGVLGEGFGGAVECEEELPPCRGEGKPAAIGERPRTRDALEIEEVRREDRPRDIPRDGAVELVEERGERVHGRSVREGGVHALYRFWACVPRFRLCGLCGGVARVSQRCAGRSIARRHHLRP